MKFEIINPSDEAYLIAEDSKIACLASAVVCDQHGLREIDGKLTMPPLAFFQESDLWWFNTFKESIEESWKRVDKKKIIKTLRSFHLVRKRTSIRDFVGYAHKLADRMEHEIQANKESRGMKK